MADPAHTPSPREVAREVVRAYIRATLFLELPPGVTHLDLTLPPATPGPRLTPDDIYGLQRRGDTTRRALGHVGDPTASTALTVEQRKRAHTPPLRLTHADVVVAFNQLDQTNQQVIQSMAVMSVKQASYAHRCTRQAFHDRMRDAIDMLVDRLYAQSKQRVG